MSGASPDAPDFRVVTKGRGNKTAGGAGVSRLRNALPASPRHPAWQNLTDIPLPSTGARATLIADGSDRRAAKGYDLLRTQTNAALIAKGWNIIAIAQSRSQGKASAVTALNLALSEARRPGRKVVLVDLDLERQPISRLLDSPPPTPEEGLTLNSVTERLALVRVAAHEGEMTEMLMDPKFHEQLENRLPELDPQIILLHLPPLLDGDAAIASLNLAHTVLLVIDGCADTAADVRHAEKRIGTRCPVLGLFLYDAEG